MTYQQALQRMMMSIRMTGISISRTQAKKLKREVAAKFLDKAMDYPGWEGRLKEIWGYSGDPRFEWIENLVEKGVSKKSDKKRCQEPSSLTPFSSEKIVFDTICSISSFSERSSLVKS